MKGWTHPQEMQRTGCVRDSACQLRRGGGLIERLFRAPIWCPPGGGRFREAGHCAAESLAGRSSTRKRTVARSIGRVSTIFCKDGGQLDRRQARGVLNPCARESKARTGSLYPFSSKISKFLGSTGLYSQDNEDNLTPAT